MKRIIKKPEIRREEIIQAATKLFEQTGYENTPVEAIIKAAGIAKGTFYYYFKTKKDILQAVVLQIGSTMVAHFEAIVELKKMTAINKLKRMIRGTEKTALSKSSVMAAIHKPENRALQEQLNIQTIELIAPLMVKVFKQGHQEGVFKSEISIESVQIILAASQFLLDSGYFDWPAQKRVALLHALQHIAEQLIGVQAGVLSFISKE